MAEIRCQAPALAKQTFKNLACSTFPYGLFCRFQGTKGNLKLEAPGPQTPNTRNPKLPQSHPAAKQPAGRRFLSPQLDAQATTTQNKVLSVLQRVIIALDPSDSFWAWFGFRGQKACFFGDPPTEEIFLPGRDLMP